MLRDGFEIRELDVSYGAIRALQGVSLKVPAGAIVTLIGSNGVNDLSGAGGNDLLIGGGGGDALNGGSGDRDVASYENASTFITLDLETPAGNTGDAAGDSFTGIERFRGSGFSDRMSGNDAANFFEGGSGKDELNGRGGADQLFGGDDSDTLDGGSDADTLRGEAGDDLILGGAGGDAIDGGGGGDVLSYALSPAAITLNLGNPASNTGDAAGDSIDGVELIRGTEFGDDMRLAANAPTITLQGLGGNDFLAGGNAADTLEGGEGRDILRGGAGGDALSGGDNIDAVTYANATTGVILDLADISQNSGDAAGDSFGSVELFFGSLLGDTMRGTAGADSFDGNNGDDTLAGGAGGDTLSCNLGTDTVTFEAAADGVTVDLVNAAANTFDAAGDSYFSIEIFLGSQQRDIMRGNANGNIFIGADGIDTLSGADGNDTLDGGLQGDNLIGGAGADLHRGGDGVDNADYRPSTATIVAALDGTLAGVGDAAGDTFETVENITGSATARNQLRGDAGNNLITGGGCRAWMVSTRSEGSTASTCCSAASEPTSSRAAAARTPSSSPR